MDYLETLPYCLLQKWAKEFKIRANQKAGKLRKCLLDHVDAIKLQSIGDAALAISCSTPRKSNFAITKTDNCSLDDNACVISEQQSVNLTIRRSSFDNELGILQSFDKRTSGTDDSLKKEFKTDDNSVEDESLEDGLRDKDENKLNETYSLSPDDDSMKENIAPEQPFSPPRNFEDNNGSLIVIEEEFAFLIYEKSEGSELNQKAAVLPELEAKKVPSELVNCSIDSQLRKADNKGVNSDLTVEKKTPRSNVTKQGSVSATKSASKAPNFKLIHQRQFEKMESIADFQKRKQLAKVKHCDRENLQTSKIPCPASQKSTHQWSELNARSACQPFRVNRTPIPAGLPARGILTSNNANAKQLSCPKSAALVSKRMPMSAYNAKRKHAFQPKFSAGMPPIKKLKLDAPNPRPAPSWRM